MDPNIRPRRSQPIPGAAGRPEPGYKSRPWLRQVPLWLSIVLSVLAALIIGWFVYQSFFAPSLVDKNKYQAVFLNNGQVYFGKLNDFNSSKPYMTDVYYFQAAEATDEQAEASQTLIKLGEEIHKPEDKLILNADSILFVENIENDGSVVQAIKENN